MRSAVLLVLVLATVACGSKDEPDQQPASPRKGAAEPPPMFGDSPPPAPTTPAEQARQLFASTCATCHGPRGGADSALAARLSPPPRDHGDPAWQDSVTDPQIAAIIVGGGAAVGQSASMPARPELAREPELLDALVALIRSFRR